MIKGFLLGTVIFSYFYNIVWVFQQSSINSGIDYISILGVIFPPLGAITGFLHIL